MDEALRSGIKLITELCKADTAIVRYAQNDGAAVRPFYRIGSLDFTSRFCRIGHGAVGEVITNKRAALS